MSHTLINQIQKLLFAVVFSLLTCLGIGQTGIMKYRVSQSPWNPDSLGNHRIVIHVTSKGSVAKVKLPWRRRDHDVSTKGIIVVDAKQNTVISNVKTTAFTRKSGTVYFEPTSGPGTYYIYYMPYHLKGTYYPTTIYYPMSGLASADWLSKTS